MAKQNFQYLLILDFEATCFKKFDNPDFGAQSQEIIEFPALKLNPETLTVESTFQEFVKPVIHPELSDFCTKLTSITQHDVDNSGVFAEVLKRFNAWYEKEVGASSCLPITCGDWDLKTMLPNQCRREGIPVPPALRQWHNLKKSYCAATSVYCRSLTEMLHGLSLSFEGRLHRGIDDCRNINTIVVELLKRGIVFNPTGRL
ncbi:hypothetical protein HAZT_HAZT001943 [Hyalella azteca]|uniref:Exonuclease domain-containing protein n=1 Tax=Hyalella azteca TaxID=294128 RepID=A0A6A0HAN8_HYAAZ|nr:hypothetical protein HAZT_HAZT001943 [Hyalella azteca]